MIMRLLIVCITSIRLFVNTVGALPQLPFDENLYRKTLAMVLVAKKTGNSIAKQKLSSEDLKKLSFPQLASLIAGTVQRNPEINLYQGKNRLYWYSLAVGGVVLSAGSFMLGHSIAHLVFQEMRYRRFLAAMRDANVADYRPGGVDVHAGNRDVRTIDAYRQLRRVQGEVAPAVIDREFAAFNQYLEQFPDQRVRDRARRALYAPGNPWPGLCAGDAPQVEGLNGRQIIARLWMFADGVADQALAREGMVRALADSYEGGQLVCGPGMRQRLAVRVLQGEGRLAGVDIDGLAALARANRPVDNMREAINDFFRDPAHQRIDNRADLQRAAEGFLRVHNRVDRARFMQQMQDYAREQEFA